MKADNEDLHMANRSTTTSGRAPRIEGAAACLYCVLVISVLVLLEHCWPGPTHLYEEDPDTIRDVSGQPLYQGKSLDYWILVADEDLRANEALAALGPVAAPLLVERLKATDTRVPATDTLLLMGSAARAAVPELVKLLQQKDSDKHTVFLAVTILGNIGPEAAAALPALLALVETNRGSLYRPTIQTLGCIGPKARAAVPVLREALESPDDLIRVRAAEALWRIERRWETVLPTLHALNEQSSRMSAEVARILLLEIEAERVLAVAAHTDKSGLPRAGLSPVNDL